MRKDKRLQLLNVSLILFAVISIGYGLLHLFFPEVYLKASNINPSPTSEWVRWFGPVLISLGVGALMVIRNPVKQGIFITILAAGNFIGGLTQFYSYFFKIADIGNPWDTISPAIVNLILSLLFLLSLKQAKDILW